MPPELQNNFKALLEGNMKFLAGLPSRTEFMQLTEKSLQFLQALKKNADATLASISTRADGVLAQMRDDHATDLDATKTTLQRSFDALSKDQQRGLNFLYDKVRTLKNGRDANPADVVPLVLAALPDDPDETPEQLRDRLETLEGDARLDKSAVKGIDTIEERVQQIELRPAAGRGGAKGIGLYIGGAKKLLTAQSINLIAGTGMTITYNFANGRNDITLSSTGSSGGSFLVLDATGMVDDSNTAFTFASKPSVVIVNGASYRENSGWSWNSGTTTATLDNPVGSGGNIYGIG